MVDERAVGDPPAAGVHATHVTSGRGPYEVEVVDGHVQYVRVAHRVPEVLGREEHSSISLATYPARRQLPQHAFHHEPLHGAERSIVTVVLADHQDTFCPNRGLDELERVFEAGGQRLLTKDVLACLERGPRHGVVRARRRGDQHGVALDAREGLLQDSVARGGFYITAGFGVRVDDSGKLDAGGSCHHPGPALAPDTEPGLDYADDVRSPSRDAPASPLSSQAISSGVSSTAPASTLALNSSPVLQPTRAKISSG